MISFARAFKQACESKYQYHVKSYVVRNNIHSKHVTNY